MPISLARTGTLCVLAFASVHLQACVAPSAAKPVIASQREALDRARRAWTQDLDMLRSQVSATLSARETLLRGEAHRELIARGHITPALEADAGAFDRDLADPDARSALLTEVRLGRLTRDQAHDFLSDYALALKMKREGPTLRDSMLARLQPMEDAKNARAIIAESLRQRRDEAARLLDDAAASNAALADFADRASIEDDPAAAEPMQAWRELLARLTQPTKP